MGPQGFRTVTIQQMLNDKNEANIKQYYEADAQGNPTNIYYAQANASGGEACLEQVLEYGTTASGVTYVQKQAWREAVWSGSAWDITTP